VATSTTQLDLPGVRERVLGVVRGLLEELGSHGAVAGLGIQSNLDRDLGLGSLERVELLARLEAAFSVRLSDRIAAEANTPDDLIHAILAAPDSGITEEDLASLASSATAVESLAEAPDSIVEKAETLLDVLRHRGLHDAARTHLVIFEDDADPERPQQLTFGELYSAGLRCAERLARGWTRLADAPDVAAVFYLLRGNLVGWRRASADLSAVSRRSH
jgi:fatty-acyl-CoA synthase